jgi:ATP-dependent helicase YprA (DUF1998 family)
LALEASRKVTNLYLHQTNAIKALWEGKHVIVSTSTASGKSVIYQVRLLSKPMHLASEHHFMLGADTLPFAGG